MVRFVHSADWQIGMPAHFLAPEAQSRYAAARVEVIRRIGAVAAAERADFVLVCGDVFDANQLSAQTVRRALDALRDVPVPVYLLPGNHDPLDDLSVLRSDLFTREAPENVHVLDRSGIHQIAPGVELVAAPWVTKFPETDLVAQAMRDLPAGPAPEGVTRIVAGHGIVDTLDRSRGRNPAVIATQPLLEALAQHQIHYVALGDRHSLTPVANTDAIHYAGAPEPTADREVLPGHVIVVDIDPDQQSGKLELTPHRVGSWAFSVQTHRVDHLDDVHRLDQALAELPDKDRTIVQLELTGTLTVAEYDVLDQVRERYRDRFAAVNERSQNSELAVVSDQQEWDALGLSGFLATAVEELQAEAGQVEVELQGLDDDPESDELEIFVPGRPDDHMSAQDALKLLYRLTGGAQ